MFSEHTVSVLQMKRVLDMDWDDDCTTIGTYVLLMNCTLNMVVTNFTLHVFYQNKKRLQKKTWFGFQPQNSE